MPSEDVQKDIKKGSSFDQQWPGGHQQYASMLPPLGPHGGNTGMHTPYGHEGSHQNDASNNQFDPSYFGAIPGISNLNNIASNNSANTGGNNLNSINTMNHGYEK